MVKQKAHDEIAKAIRYCETAQTYLGNEVQESDAPQAMGDAIDALIRGIRNYYEEEIEEITGDMKYG